MIGWAIATEMISARTQYVITVRSPLFFNYHICSAVISMAIRRVIKTRKIRGFLELFAEWSGSRKCHVAWKDLAPLFQRFPFFGDPTFQKTPTSVFFVKLYLLLALAVSPFLSFAMAPTSIKSFYVNETNFGSTTDTYAACNAALNAALNAAGHPLSCSPSLGAKYLYSVGQYKPGVNGGGTSIINDSCSVFFEGSFESCTEFQYYIVQICPTAPSIIPDICKDYYDDQSDGEPGCPNVSSKPTISLGFDNSTHPNVDGQVIASLDTPLIAGIGNPINVSVGNKYQTETDVVFDGIFPLEVKRTYNSTSGRWQFFSQVIPLSATEAKVIRPDGKGYIFFPYAQNYWAAAPNNTSRLESSDDGLGTITGWRYITLNHQVEEYNANGRLLSVTNRTGLSHTYTYTSTETTVTHSNGDVLVYHLDGASRITGFTTPDQSQYTFHYDIQSRLSGITYPNTGGTRTYHYENLSFPVVLTGITDANGERFATWTYDANGRAISSEHHGGAEKVTIDYTHIDDATDPRSIVTNALGKQTTYHFADIFGARKVTQIEGHPSANCLAANKNYSYDTNGFIASKTDWKGITTTFVRNAKGQELSRTEAGGTPDERTITTQWHATFNLRTKVTEPGRETTYTYDANGNLLSQSVVDLVPQ